MPKRQSVEPTAGRETLARLMARPESEWTLCQAALLAARELAYPDLAVAAYQAALADASSHLTTRVPVHASTRFRLAALNEYMFQTLGYAGDSKDYYDPRNSYLNEVIDRRLGIPITLSMLYLEFGRHLGLDLTGISFPGHFLVKVELEGGIAVLDPYLGGVSLDEADLLRRLSSGQTAASELVLSQCLRDASRRDILTRMLRNLKLIYLQGESWELALAVCNSLVITSNGEPGELRDRGLVLDQLECPAAALDDLESYLALEPEAVDGGELRERVRVLREMAKPAH
jgi:regulator of sirC expression with transglutaminase-like and TPR domain